MLSAGVRTLLFGAGNWSIQRLLSVLFGNGQVGWAHWFDAPSLYPGGNHLYLYQDSAGTTPGTAAGDTIGLHLDRAYGGYRGSELGVNGDFASDTWWTKGTDWVISGGVASRGVSASFSNLSRPALLTVGKTYQIQLDIVAISGTVTVLCGGGSSISFTTTGRKSTILTCSGDAAFYIQATGGAVTCTIDNVSIREIPGTHRIQASAPSRPLLMARVNLLLDTELLTAASWTKSNVSVAASPAADPNGGSKAFRITSTAADGFAFQSKSPTVSGATYKNRMFVRRVSGTGVVKFFGPNGSSFTDITAALSTSWAEFTYSGTQPGIAYGPIVQLGTSGDVVDVAFPDLRTADDAAKNIPSYQRVGATAADHDTAGFPHAAYPDGTDDFDTTSTGGGGSAGFFFCGVLTVSGGAGTDRTIWSDTGTNAGYRVRINASNKLELAAGNGSAYTTVQSNETITAPGTYLLSAWDDGGVLAVQVGNAAAATTARPAVSAGTSTITSYRDNGAATSYFNGRDYGSVYRQTYPGETAHNRLKAWQARRAGITV